MRLNIAFAPPANSARARGPSAETESGEANAARQLEFLRKDFVHCSEPLHGTDRSACRATIALTLVTPGGRIGIIVRSLDLPQWWNLDLPESIGSRLLGQERLWRTAESREQ